MPVCVITRAPHGRSFTGIADHCYCAAKRQHDYDFHEHLLVSFEGTPLGARPSWPLAGETPALPGRGGCGV
ncbi:hypothetical protein [Thiocystis violascens]|uniref:hypothetical protein n=1 Tax=Thiocystis violascens TaxID=73141 RepID=UPI0012F69679|nr:hypothetical protein [Thiocystis violascens]